MRQCVCVEGNDMWDFYDPNPSHVYKNKWINFEKNRVHIPLSRYYDNKVMVHLLKGIGSLDSQCQFLGFWFRFLVRS